MTWLTPAIAGIAAAIAVPSLLILYFLKLRRRDLEISTTLLWKKAIEDLHANAPFQRLRRNLLLFLQLLVLAAALLALGQPEMKSGTTPGGRHIIMIDHSASMSALDAPGKDGAKQPRLQAAKEEAARLVDSLREPSVFDLGTLGGGTGDQAMVMSFAAANDATVLQHFTSDKSLLKAAIESIKPTDGPSRLMPAIKIAKSYIPKIKPDERKFVTVSPATLHVISDGRLPDSTGSADSPDDPNAEDLTGEDNVIYHAVGGADSFNVGITELRAERFFDKPGRVSIFVGLQNSGLKPCTTDVQLLVESTEPALRQVTIPAATVPAQPDSDEPTPAGAPPTPAPPAAVPGTTGVVFVLDRPEGGIVTVRLLPAPGSDLGALAADDSGYLVVPPAKRLTVGLVTTGDLFLRTALESVNLSGLIVIGKSQFERMLVGDKIEGVGLPELDVIVLDGIVPDLVATDGTKSPGLPPGRLLVMGVVPPPPQGLVDEGAGDYTEIIDFQADHPALRHAGLANLRIAKGRKVKLPDGSEARVLAQSTLGPAIVEVTDVDTHALILPFDPGDSDWAFNPGWIMFLGDAVNYLASGGLGALGGGVSVGNIVRPGDTLSTRIPVDSAEARISLPDKARMDLSPAVDGSVSFGPLRTVGMYTVSWLGSKTPVDIDLDGRAARPFAANLLDPDESDIATRPTIPMAGRVVAAQTKGESEATRKLWPWLVLGALAVVMLEWFIYNRKVYV